LHVEERSIEMPDGIQLAADLFLPDDFTPDGGRPGGGGVPVVLEYLPYRKDDGRLRTWDLFSYIVERGYVGARVDIRGTGRSGGVLPDREYSEQEQGDAEVVIDCLSRQLWCNGSVGMWGISWGGFNSIHMAMRETTPEALKAIAACMATDDLFHDDIHYIDGMMHLDEYAVMVDLLNTMPPAPDFELEEETLRARFDQPPWLLTWLRHQRLDEFWERGSLRPRYERLRVPSYLMGGYFDGYRDSVPRMLEHARVPVRGLMGPWNHSWPHNAVPGPEVEWRADVLRWFDRFLKDDPNGIEDEPPFTVFLRDSYPPGTALTTIPGRWLSEESWPVARLESRVLHLTADRALGAEPSTSATHRLAYVPSAGTNAGMWWGELTPDQRPADAFSLAYETVPLPEPLQILGFPVVVLAASVDAPTAQFFARLCDVAPDGSTTLVDGGGLNGAHRISQSEPSPLEPGVSYDLSFELHFTSYVFPVGHRVRLSISNSTFPMIWPTPYPMTLSLAVGGDAATRLVLPVLPGPDREGRSGSLEVEMPPSSGTVGMDGFVNDGFMLPLTWTVERDEANGVTTVRWEGRESATYPWAVIDGTEGLEYTVADDDPAHASARGQAKTDVRTSSGRKITFRHDLTIESDEQSFAFGYTRQLYEAGELVRERKWEERLGRDHQ
jgi:putative CocE/NonD family hydrolase